MLRRIPSLLAAALIVAASVRGSVDPTWFDTSVKPQDDFFHFADGAWIKNNPVPPEYTRWGSPDILQVSNIERLDKLCAAAAAKGAAGTPTERLVGDLYASGMDEAAVNAAGAGALKPEFDRIAAVRTPADVMAAIAHLHSEGVGAGFNFYGSADAKDSDRVIAHLRQGGISLPDRDYYLNDDDKSKKLREQYVAHVSLMLQLLGDTPASADLGAQAVLRIETELARASLSREVLRNPYASYHKMAVADLAAYTPHIDWPAFFKAAGAPEFTSLNFQQPDFFKAFDAQLAGAPAADWQVYLRWHLIHQEAHLLSEPFVQENFHFFNQTLSGAKKLLPRWKRVVAEVDGDVGEALGRLYVDAYFPPEAKERMLALVGNLKAALRQDLSTLAWMDDATRTKAIAKLDALGVKVGYPDSWRDYSALSVDRGSYVLNAMRADAFETRRTLARIGGPVDHREWHLTAPTVNAYYSPLNNEIVFPAGILQPPYFDVKADDATNYGGIGVVIGHEMTHGFDDQGRQYDPKGNLTDWWSPESAAHFKERAQAIVAQFSGYTVLDGVHVIGERTQGENIADLGGVRIAYAALQKALAGRPREKVDGYTPEQRFFISFASVWASSITPEAQRLRVKTDPHAPAQFRVNGPLSNLDEFAQAFDVPEGAPMRRPAASRVSIW